MKEEEKISLTPYLVAFVQSSIDKQSQQVIMDKICEFYTDFLQNLYKVNSAKDMGQFTTPPLEKQISSNPLMNKIAAGIKQSFAYEDQFSVLIELQRSDSNDQAGSKNLKKELVD